MKKILALFLAISMILPVFTGCDVFENYVKDDSDNDDSTLADNSIADKDEDTSDAQQPEDEFELPEYGSDVGNRFMDVVLDGLDGEKVKTSDYRGKYIVLNFWGTWCGPCKSELPHFSQFASDYADEVVVIAAHSSYQKQDAKDYIDKNYADSKIIFAYDIEIDNKGVDIGYISAGGKGSYPRTVIIDPRGVIIYEQDGAIGYSELESAIKEKKENPESKPEEEPENKPENQPENKPEPEIGTKIGDRFADVTIEGMNGESINTADYRGSIIILNIWATWCGPCKSELPDFQKIANTYANDVVIIAAHDSYGRENAPTYIKNNFPTTKILFGYDNDAGDAFYAAGGTIYVPRTVIIDRDGIIIYARDGSMTYAELDMIINQYK